MSKPLSGGQCNVWHGGQPSVSQRLLRQEEAIKTLTKIVFQSSNTFMEHKTRDVTFSVHVSCEGKGSNENISVVRNDAEGMEQEVVLKKIETFFLLLIFVPIQTN